MNARDDLIQAFKDHGQAHVFNFFDTLSNEEQSELLAQASSIDLSKLASYISAFKNNDNTCPSPSIDTLKPAGYIAHPGNGGSQKHWDEAKKIGESALRAGRVAAFTVAGGQGTRLGFDGPKGTLKVTLLQNKSLFQIFAEKIKAAQERYEQNIPWFIMTSALNHEATIEYFKAHSFFDLEHVHFFRQGLMPAIDMKGKIMLETPASIAMSPDGHGGSIAALNKSGAIDAMQKAGIDTISYFQVDNPLVHCIDPHFIGFHLQAGSEVSSKMVPKQNADEKVGVFCLHKDKLSVIEYSDLPRNCAQAFNAKGELMYGCGNIAVHLLDVDFIKKMDNADNQYELPYHCALKKIPTVDNSGAILKPQEPNGIKFERFIFDSLAFAKNPILLETSRENEFSPIKNAEGKDSLQSAQEAQISKWRHWMRVAGIQTANNIIIEIAPTFADSEETFCEHWNALEHKPKIQDNTYLA